jgi:hypothetical protein
MVVDLEIISEDQEAAVSSLDKASNGKHKAEVMGVGRKRRRKSYSSTLTP